MQIYQENNLHGQENNIQKDSQRNSLFYLITLRKHFKYHEQHNPVSA